MTSFRQPRKSSDKYRYQACSCMSNLLKLSLVGVIRSFDSSCLRNPFYPTPSQTRPPTTSFPLLRITSVTDSDPRTIQNYPMRHPEREHRT